MCNLRNWIKIIILLLYYNKRKKESDNKTFYHKNYILFLSFFLFFVFFLIFFFFLFLFLSLLSMLITNVTMPVSATIMHFITKIAFELLDSNVSCFYVIEYHIQSGKCYSANFAVQLVRPVRLVRLVQLVQLGSVLS